MGLRTLGVLVGGEVRADGDVGSLFELVARGLNAPCEVGGSQWVGFGGGVEDVVPADEGGSNHDASVMAPLGEPTSPSAHTLNWWHGA